MAKRLVKGGSKDAHIFILKSAAVMRTCRFKRGAASVRHVYSKKETNKLWKNGMMATLDLGLPLSDGF